MPKKLKPQSCLIIGLSTAIILSSAGCATNWQTMALGAGVATASGAYSPNNEIEQVYYLGVFDPQEQLPPSVYRVRVHGQSSFISQTKFASGWVRSEFIDSLGTNVDIDQENGKISISKNSDDQLSTIEGGRKLVMFGPEGFREAPKNHRLVVVMGSNPDKFFEAIDGALGVFTKAKSDAQYSNLNGLLFQALTQTRAERQRLDDLATDVQNSFGK